jgi:hypothetical protein
MKEVLRTDYSTKKRNTRIGAGANAEPATETRRQIFTIVIPARRRTCSSGGALDYGGAGPPSASAGHALARDGVYY